MKILIFGKTGQLAKSFQDLSKNSEHNFIFIDRKQADLSSPTAINQALASNSPDIVINTAAYTAVDKAEQEVELCFAINAEAPCIMAEYCQKHDIPFIHYSTDYVFDGSGDKPRTETASTTPINSYGHSKLAGEGGITRIGGKYLILRTSWVYSKTGNNFVNTMLRLSLEKEELSIVCDQIGAPTYAPDLSAATIQIINSEAFSSKAFPSGIYHICNKGETNWFKFAKEIFKQAKNNGQQLKIKTINAIKTSDYPTPATRPLNSRLDCTKLEKTFNVKLQNWKLALQDCLK